MLSRRFAFFRDITNFRVGEVGFAAELFRVIDFPKAWRNLFEIVLGVVRSLGRDDCTCNETFDR
jgi:hypothetical protein